VAAEPANNTTGVFDRLAQTVPVRIAIADPQGLTLLPGLNVTVKIYEN